MRFFSRPFAVLLVAALSLSHSGPALAADTAVLILAHGGSPTWNKTVTETVKEAEIPYPTRIYFGMGHTREEADRMQSTLRALEGRGTRRVIVIPLLVSSYSEIYRQWRYLLGIDVNPGFNVPLFPLQKRSEIMFTEPFNDDPIIGLIVLDRAREISQDPAQETVFLVAHGPNDEDDNDKWLRMLARLGVGIRERGGFKRVVGMTLRDDAPEEVRAQAIVLLRAHVEAASKSGGKALVVPLLMSPGGIENKIGVALKGLIYTLNAKVLLPDHRVSQWIRSKVP